MKELLCDVFRSNRIGAEAINAVVNCAELADASTSYGSAYRSCLLSHADWIKLIIAVACLPLRSEPAKSQFLRP